MPLNTSQISSDVLALRAILRTGIFPGVVVYRGPSAIDGAPIAVIVTSWQGSQNGKTGAMLQSFIIRTDMRPQQAVNNGADVSICGDCPKRPSIAKQTGEKPCYVLVGQSVTSVYDTLMRGRYIDIHQYSADEISEIFAGYALRCGTYGDPGAAPHIWNALTARVRTWTGYTHQWRTNPHLAALLMASADSVAEAREAQDQGWRTFRVAPALGWAKEPGEGLCPASTEAGARTSCSKCRLCSGTSGHGRASIVIPDHSTAGRAEKARAARIAA